MIKPFTVEQVFRLENPKGKLTTKQLIDGNDIPYVAAKKTENGIAKWCSLENIPNEQIMQGNCIVFVQQGDGSAGYTTYQPEDFYAISCVCCGYIDGILDEKVGMYLMSILDKNKAFYNHSNGWNGDRLKQTIMMLPVIVHPDLDHEYTINDIDWQYMRDRITELERDRITELDAYLQATGLNDYELTEDDKKILSLSTKRASDENGTLEDNSEDEVRFSEFLLKDIAKLDNGNKFDKNKMTYENPSVYFVSRTASNNGVSDFVDNNGTTPYKVGCITLAFGGSIGSCFVQYNPFYTGQNVGVIDFGEDVSFEAKQYIALCLGKYCKTVFTAFADEINKHFKKDLTISLPIKSDGTPDFEYMERYICAMEKIVIADVVKYKDNIIEETRKIVGA